MELTPRMNRVLHLASDHAERYHVGRTGPYISTEHVLLAIAEEGEGVGARIMANLGLTKDTIRREMENIVGPPPRPIDETVKRAAAMFVGRHITKRDYEYLISCIAPAVKPDETQG